MRRTREPDWPAMVALKLDEMLQVLENPTRRRILERLVRESHYPLQLSRELGVSQQAVIKHLKALEERGLVASTEEPSDLGGPTRRAYSARQSLTVHIDVGPSLFRAEMRPLNEDVPKAPEYSWAEDALERARVERDARRRVRAVADLIRRLNQEIGKLDERRAYLVKIKDSSMGLVREAAEHTLVDYEERQVFYCLLDEGPAALDRIAEALDIREKIVANLIRRIEQEFPIEWRSLP